MDTGQQTIVNLLMGLEGRLGAASANIDRLRADTDKAATESSDRHRALCDKLEHLTEQQRELSETSERRHESVEKLRALVSGCPQHVVDVPTARLTRPADDAEDAGTRRSILKAFAAILGTIATALGGWWAAHTSK